jgi:hypothetical protein
LLPEEPVPLVPEDPVGPVETVTGGVVPNAVTVAVKGVLVPLLPLEPRVEPALPEPVELCSGCVATLRLTVAVALSTALTTSVRLVTLTATETLA